MEQLTLKEYIAKSREICDLVQKNNIGNVQDNKITLREMLNRELMMFSVYIANLDGGGVNKNETDFISDNLGMMITDMDVLQIKLDGEKYLSNIPATLKYLVLADASKKIDNDPFKNQKSMILYDTYNLFGQSIMALHENDVNADKIKVFDEYITRMEKFIKEYGVWYAGSQKNFTMVLNSSLSDVSDDERADKLEELLDDLYSLTGLSEVKEQVKRLLNLMKVQKMRKEKNMQCSDISKHMVFAGNPGTGKTTVARKLAEIFKYMGILKKGQLVEVDRSGLVRGYIGQTATRTSEVIEEARGGILFIDEAYTLTVNKGEGDFGQEAVDTVLKAMEDLRDELIVIVAGYTDLMDEFLSSNPGLKSRFSNYIFFEDYNEEELFMILESMLKKGQYYLNDEASKKAKELIRKRVDNKPDNFANARDIRNFMERAISNHAMRVADNKDADEKMLSEIIPDDLEDFK
ncbi:ATPase family associated with various cellular activities (AAA) [Lachnospiraceae bacterium RM5]|nr:ATPase family associated with various cellular activities (AAA) [Lachnospiraceae bacterium RM5]